MSTNANLRDPRVLPNWRAFVALTVAGFRRWSTYRQATLAAIFTNSVFGFLKCYVLLGVLGTNATVRGYDAAQLVTFVWVGQGLLGVVLYWGWNELAERVRTGEVTADLLRPVNPLWNYLAADLGRAGFAAITRLLGPVIVGYLAFTMYLPGSPWPYALFLVSTFVALLLCFAGRYLTNLMAFWLLDVRGVLVTWTVLVNMLSGLLIPVPFLPDWARAIVWWTPFPALYQVPLDVLLRRDSLTHSATMIGYQLLWGVVLYAACLLVQRRATKRLVIQGG